MLKHESQSKWTWEYSSVLAPSSGKDHALQQAVSKSGWTWKHAHALTASGRFNHRIVYVHDITFTNM